MNQNQVVSFDYGEFTIRIVTLDNGEPGFVASDVAKVLKIRNVSQMTEQLDEDEKGICKTDTPGGMQELLILTEPGFYVVLTRSNKPQAKPFRRWVTHEVLPAIRKRGYYALPNSESPTPNDTPRIPPAHIVRETIGIANAFGFVGNQGLLSANRMVRKLFGLDCLDLLGHKTLICEKQERHLTPTEIGKIIGGLSPQKVNLLLEKAGIIESYRDTKDRKKWKPTEKGKPYIILKDTDKKHKDGTPVQQMFFLESVISVLKKDTKPQTNGIDCIRI